MSSVEKICGLLLIILSFAGCSSSTSPTPSTGAATSAPPISTMQSVYLPEVLPTGTGGILQVSTTASGAVKPVTAITDAAGGLGYMAVDGSGNLYAIETTVSTNSSSFAIVEYAAGASGAATPVRRIAGSATGLSPFPSPTNYSIYPIAVDAKGDIVVGIGSTIEYFSSTDNGNVAPVRKISGAGLQTIHLTLTPDGTISTINLGLNGYQVFTFPAGASGTVSPSIVTTFPFNTLVDGLYTDVNGYIYVSSTSVTVANNEFTSFTPTIQVFQPGAVTPIKTISPQNDPVRMAGIQLDAAGNLYVLCEDIQQTDLVLQVFAGGDSGASTPKATISSAAFANTDGTLALY